ncbi:MAG: substrate-binding domain-containing protein [Actinobacteria bacterium]|nr:substrate-binding domain-containing protein [Actinomycetota bacterium]
MKKLFICLLGVIFMLSMTFIGVGCKEEAVEEVAEAPAEEAPAEEAPAEEAPAEEAPVEELTFTFIDHGDPADPFHAKIIKGWNEAGEKLGVTTNEQFAYDEFAKTIDYTDAAIAAEVDGIFVFSVDAEGLQPSVQKAVDQGIEVVLMSSRDPVLGPEQVPFIGFDLEEQGYVLGKYLAKQLEDSGVADIGFFAEFNAPYSQMRRAGILRALDDAGIEYVAADIYEVGVDLGVAIDKTKSYMIANPDTDALLGMGSLTTPACAMVLEELGYEPGEVKWAGFDLAPETIDAIEAGYGASNVDEVFNYGFYACMALYLRAKYDFVIGDLPVATTMVDSTNIEGFLAWVELGIK